MEAGDRRGLFALGPAPPVAVGFRPSVRPRRYAAAGCGPVPSTRARTHSERFRPSARSNSASRAFTAAERRTVTVGKAAS